ncbi:hypothetical protein ABGB16_31330 [Micromonospora sp. B11E3]|uniref:hypothetical protein n=1 Tax=Micromonospora sp. B11E3 TaxID=3153562 RepID=UPI00325C6A09
MRRSTRQAAASAAAATTSASGPSTSAITTSSVGSWTTATSRQSGVPNAGLDPSASGEQSYRSSANRCVVMTRG